MNRVASACAECGELAEAHAVAVAAEGISVLVKPVTGRAVVAAIFGPVGGERLVPRAA